ncbi:CD209 antigen-like isoform X2 [Palaemon carinicauda]|uniref:CD209 antigen-like isoform X2 n=1 Tax=Palaemon carinicauda TaxID=392227 RepID=UPI0035B5EB9A
MMTHRVLSLLMLCMMLGSTMGSALPEDLEDSITVPPIEASDEDAPATSLQQQAEDNANAIRKLAEVMKTLVATTSSQRCLGTQSSAQQLTDSIKDGFSVLVGAVKDLNNTMRHFKEDLGNKLSISKIESAFEDDGPCPAPFFLAGEDCLYIETENLRYFDAARQACTEMGAKLAEFTTYNHFISAVSSMDLHEDAEIYVGGSDRESEGTWKWLSGERMKNIPWGSGEPNNLYLEDCIALNPRWKKFNDLRCSLRREYVCKWKK